MNIQFAYDDWSATYDADQNLTRDLDQAITRKTLMRLRFKSAIELGCGTGKNTVFLSEIAENVHAIDFSESMLEKAKSKLNSTNVVFSIADLRQPWLFEDRSADLVISNLVLEHVENLAFIFSEASRVLVNGGYFFISELHAFKQYRGAKANFQRGAAIVEIPAFVHHLSDFFSLARTHGFVIEEFKEWWHEHDHDKPPRLASFLAKLVV
jgi:ubiquinone/menaquinone biosynthesis C-methylase UbiE